MFTRICPSILSNSSIQMQVLTFNLLQRIFSETESCRELSEQWNESCERFFESRRTADENSPSPAVRVERVTTRSPKASPASPSSPYMRAKRRGICKEYNFEFSTLPPECLNLDSENSDQPFEDARMHMHYDYYSLMIFIESQW